MNKTIYPSGHQIEVDATLWEFDIDALTNGINNILSGLVDPVNTIYIVSGCQLNGTVDPSLTSGAVFYNNELFAVDATVFTGKTSSDINNYYFDLQESWQPDGTRLSYTDGTTKETKKVRKAVLKPVASVFSGNPTFSNVVNIRTELNSLKNNTLEKGSPFVASKIVQTDVNSKLVTADIKSAYNKDFGTDGDTVAYGNHTHSGYVVGSNDPNAINSIKILWAGNIVTSPVSYSKYFGTSAVNNVVRNGDGDVTISHGFGTANYIVTGVSTDSARRVNKLCSVTDKTSGSFKLVLADDNSANDGSADLIIYGWQ